jgi:hypothetical protein
MSGPFTMLRSRVDSDNLLLDEAAPYRKPWILPKGCETQFIAVAVPHLSR